MVRRPQRIHLLQNLGKPTATEACKPPQTQGNDAVMSTRCKKRCTSKLV